MRFWRNFNGEDWAIVVVCILAAGAIVFAVLTGDAQ